MKKTDKQIDRKTHTYIETEKKGREINLGMARDNDRGRERGKERGSGIDISIDRDKDRGRRIDRDIGTDND